MAARFQTTRVCSCCSRIQGGRLWRPSSGRARLGWLGGRPKRGGTDGLKGTVKVTKSEADSFVADVDLTDGKATIKGTFEAKSWKSGGKK